MPTTARRARLSPVELFAELLVLVGSLLLVPGPAACGSPR
jgi:hypothetical protein